MYSLFKNGNLQHEKKTLPETDAPNSILPHPQKLDILSVSVFI